jgi:hypothetical protein
VAARNSYNSLTSVASGNNPFRLGFFFPPSDAKLKPFFLGGTSCLVLYTPRAGRTLPAGEGGCAAGSLRPSHYLKLGPAVRCRSPPEFVSPFALSGSSVGQRGIFAQTTQLLIPAKQTISVS